MISAHERFDENKLLQKILDHLDISESDYERAVTAYEGVGKYLESKLGEGTSIYPQGSFLYGTVTRPYMQGKDANYDIDLVCEYIPQQDTESTCKNLCGDALKKSKLYGEMLKEDEGRRCWTLEYEKSSALDFHMDVLPCKHATQERIQRLLDRDVPEKYARTAIMITHKTDKDYEWRDSNPKGFKAWLDDITAPYKQQKRVFCEDSVESVPEQSETKTPVHKVIQILKRHRDIRFDDSDIKDDKPISMILTTLALRVAEQNVNKSISVLDLLEQVIMSADVVKRLNEQRARYDAFENTFIKRKENGVWVIENPVDPDENFADKWHEDNNAKAKAFFAWVEWIKSDLLVPLRSRDSVGSFNALSNGFGQGFIKTVYDEMRLPITKPILSIKSESDMKSMPKPWKSHE